MRRLVTRQSKINRGWRLGGAEQPIRYLELSPCDPLLSSADGVLAVLATGAGFLGLTLAYWAVTRGNPFETWWWNLKNHARFYEEFPRSYALWVAANPVELAVALGLPVALWAAVGLSDPRFVASGQHADAYCDQDSNGNPIGAPSPT